MNIMLRCRHLANDQTIPDVRLDERRLLFWLIRSIAWKHDIIPTKLEAHDIFHCRQNRTNSWPGV